MSGANFDRRDREDTSSTGNEWIRLMARSGGFVMVRRSRQKPFVLSEKEWAKLPLFQKEQAA